MGLLAAAAGPGCFRRLSIALTAVSVIGFALLNITLDEQALFGSGIPKDSCMTR